MSGLLNQFKRKDKPEPGLFNIEKSENIISDDNFIVFSLIFCHAILLKLLHTVLLRLNRLTPPPTEG